MKIGRLEEQAKMRCDLCPLCPIAQDDVCFEAEGKYGIEHADGMLGCKHPWNWVKKRDKEYDEYLGVMGTDIGIEMSFSEEGLKQVIELCKHMVGLDYRKPYHRHGKTFYKPYRNYFTAQSKHKLFEKLPDWIINKRQDKESGHMCYWLTREGLDWLGRQINITIRNEED